MLTPSRVVGMTVWQANADEYKLCCRSIHVRRGALVVGLAGIAIAILAAILLTLAYVRGGGGELKPNSTLMQLARA
jgi:hypothetical protein